MKILEVITSLSSGGGERFVTDLCNELSLSKNDEIELLVLKDDKLPEYSFYTNELRPTIKYSCLGERKFSIKSQYKVWKAIRKRKPDIVHIHLNGTLNMVIPTIFMYRKPIYVQTLHGRADKQFGSKLDFFCKKLLYKLSLVKLISISSDNEKSFSNTYNCTSNALIINGRGEMLSINPDIVKKEIDSLKPNRQTIIIAHVARLHPEKNQQLLIEGFNRIVANGANAILLIIGGGFDSEKGKELQALACKNIHFMGLKKNVSDYLKYADAFILSSLNEAMPISLIEALACRCIPLSTPVSGCIDIIKNGENGFIAKDFTLDAFVAMLNDFLGNYDKIDRDSLYEYYQKNLSMKSCAQKYLEFFKRKI
jgi:glycosyltransferase involved in cell wall biosynthesis